MEVAIRDSKGRFVKGHKLLSNKGQFKAGQKPWNKGIKGAVNSGSFKKDHKESYDGMYWKGKTFSEQHRQHISQGTKGHRALKGKEHPYWGKHLPKSTRAKISQKLIGHKPHYPKLRYSEHLGHSVRSSWEETLCCFLKEHHVEYQYKAERLYTTTEPKTSWLPDLKVGNTFIEVKGWAKEQTLIKYARIINETKCRIIFVVPERDIKQFTGLSEYVVPFHRLQSILAFLPMDQVRL